MFTLYSEIVMDQWNRFEYQASSISFSFKQELSLIHFKDFKQKKSTLLYLFFANLTTTHEEKGIINGEKRIW
jgi:hypothetical protein